MVLGVTIGEDDKTPMLIKSAYDGTVTHVVASENPFYADYVKYAFSRPV